MDDHYRYLCLLTNTLWTLREKNILCDTVLIAEDKELAAHSIVLAAGCTTFREVFAQASAGEDAMFRIEMPGIDGNTLESVLLLIYKGPSSNTEFRISSKGNFLLFQQTCQQLGLDFVNKFSKQLKFSNIKREIEDLNIDSEIEWQCNTTPNDENVVISLENSPGRYAGSNQIQCNEVNEADLKHDTGHDVSQLSANETLSDLGNEDGGLFSKNDNRGGERSNCPLDDSLGSSGLSS